MLRNALNPRFLVQKLRGLSGTALGKFATASAVVQGLPLLSAPILARLYSPEAYGSYGVFYALTAILSTIALLSLNNAILNEQDEQAAFNILLSLPIPCGGFCLIVLAGLMFSPAGLLQALIGSVNQNLLMCLPLTVFFASMNTAGYTWLLRTGRYGFLAKYKLVLGFSTLALQISIGVLGLEALGLILANLAGYILAGAIILLHVRRTDKDLLVIKPRLSFFEICKKNRGLVAHTTSAGLVNRLGSYLPDLLINRFFGAAVLGQYSFGMRAVVLPTAFISSTVQDVFRREAAQEFAQTGGCVRSFTRVFQLMVGIACFIIFPVILLLPVIFPFVFGSVWSESGSLVQAVTVLILVRFVSSPLSYVWIVTGRTGLDLLWQITLVILTAGVFFGIRWLYPDVSPVELLFGFALVAGSWYLFCLALSYRWSRAP